MRGIAAIDNISLIVALVALILVLTLYVILYHKLWHRTRKSRIPVHSGVVVVDGSNVAFHRVGKGKGKIRNILIVLRSLEKKGFDVKIVVDASLRYRIDNPNILEKLVREGKIIQAPPGTPADYFILKLAEDLNAAVISNDMYRDWWREFPWARGTGKIIRYVIEGKRAYFYPDIYPTHRVKRKHKKTEEEEEYLETSDHELPRYM
ncbi:MAG TPA: hypothetical protein ENG44_03590 [Desulfurococcaceae archaeon]|nr:hypothetical protein [Desulfurococcaceae archaeon]